MRGTTPLMRMKSCVGQLITRPDTRGGFLGNLEFSTLFKRKIREQQNITSCFGLVLGSQAAKTVYTRGPCCSSLLPRVPELLSLVSLPRPQPRKQAPKVGNH